MLMGALAKVVVPRCDSRGRACEEPFEDVCLLTMVLEDAGGNWGMVRTYVRSCCGCRLELTNAFTTSVRGVCSWQYAYSLYS